jgi:hypothetical protein
MFIYKTGQVQGKIGPVGFSSVLHEYTVRLIKLLAKREAGEMK